MDRDAIDNDIVLSTNIQPSLVLYTSVDRDVNDDDKVFPCPLCFDGKMLINVSFNDDKTHSAGI